MRMNVNLPIRVEVSDYHEFSNLQNMFKEIIPSIRVKEFGFNGDYIGIAYVGKLTNPKVKKLIEEIKEESKEWDY